MALNPTDPFDLEPGPDPRDPDPDPDIDLIPRDRPAPIAVRRSRSADPSVGVAPRLATRPLPATAGHHADTVHKAITDLTYGQAEAVNVAGRDPAAARPGAPTEPANRGPDRMTEPSLNPCELGDPCRRPITADELRALGPTINLSTAAALFGLSRATAYRLAGKGTFPVPVLRAGSQYRVPVAPILAALFPPDDGPTVRSGGQPPPTTGAARM